MNEKAKCNKVKDFEFNKQKITLFKNLERIIIPDDNKDYSS